MNKAFPAEMATALWYVTRGRAELRPTPLPPVGPGDAVDVEDPVLVRLVAEVQQVADHLALPFGQGEPQLLADDGFPAEEVAPLQGAGQVAKNPIPPTLWSYNDKVQDYP